MGPVHLFPDNHTVTTSSVVVGFCYLNTDDPVPQKIDLYLPQSLFLERYFMFQNMSGFRNSKIKVRLLTNDHYFHIHVMSTSQ